jgi:hypothetical protein
MLNLCRRGSGDIETKTKGNAMRILLCLLALVAAPAWAEWVKVDETDEMTFYIDPAKIKKGGNLRRVWELQDLKQRDNDGEMSRRGLQEYDCEEERSRVLSMSTHSEAMTGGKVIMSGELNGKWKYIAPNTVSATVLSFVCAR